jgi:hypothetical protein
MRSARRLAADFGGGLLLGIPLLAAPGLTAPSLALSTPQTQRPVEFSGGVDPLLCDSKPDRSSVTVKSESRLVFINNIGQGATLRIDGENGGPIADGQAVEVLFPRGPVAIAMVPDCLPNLGGNGTYEPVTIRVSATRPSSSGSSGGKSAVKTWPTPGPSPAAAPPADGPTTVADGPVFSLEPDAGTGAVNPVADPAAGPAAGPAPSADSAMDPAAGPAESADPTISPGGLLAGTSMNPGSDTPIDKGPIGLLTIIATVCVVGVSVGALRAIVSQHTSRVEVA